MGTEQRYHWTAEQKQQMAELYADEWSIQDIAVRFGCTRETVRYHLRRAGVVLRGRGMQTAKARAKYSGERHHGWKGGRFLDHGYWSLLRPGHPYADNDGYVKEHRLVMEEHLRATDPGHPAMIDGYLRPDWLVHHRNEDKQDNSIENLEPLSKRAHSILHAQLDKNRRNQADYIQRLESLLEENGIPF